MAMPEREGSLEVAVGKVSKGGWTVWGRTFQPLEVLTCKCAHSFSKGWVGIGRVGVGAGVDRKSEIPFLLLRISLRTGPHQLAPHHYTPPNNQMI